MRIIQNGFCMRRTIELAVIVIYGNITISIHVPQVGVDAGQKASRSLHQNFNPRPPSGGRRRGTVRRLTIEHFNPRPPSGGRPPRFSIPSVVLYFNPRPPSGGRRCYPIRQSIRHSDFNPRPPSGGRRTILILSVHQPSNISGTRPSILPTVIS